MSKIINIQEYQEIYVRAYPFNNYEVVVAFSVDFCNSLSDSEKAEIPYDFNKTKLKLATSTYSVGFRTLKRSEITDFVKSKKDYKKVLDKYK